jgi:hypothetical protein
MMSPTWHNATHLLANVYVGDGALAVKLREVHLDVGYSVSKTNQCR